MKPETFNYNDYLRLQAEMGKRNAYAEALQAENKALRNELCLKCGRYIDEHNGSCDGCRWKGATHD